MLQNESAYKLFYKQKQKDLEIKKYLQIFTWLNFVSEFHNVDSSNIQSTEGWSTLHFLLAFLVTAYSFRLPSSVHSKQWILIQLTILKGVGSLS